jgi:hypothetical protein
LRYVAVETFLSPCRLRGYLELSTIFNDYALPRGDAHALR